MNSPTSDSPNSPSAQTASTTATDPCLRLQQANEQARALLTQIGSEDLLLEATLILVWERLFYELKQRRDATPEDLLEAVSLIQKLAASTNNRKTHLLRERQQTLSEEDRAERKARLHKTLTSPDAALPPKLLKNIEKQLHLL